MRKLVFALLGIALLVVVWEHYRPQAKKPVPTTKPVTANLPVVYRCADDMPPDKVLTREQVLEAIRQSVGNFYPAVYDTMNGISITIYYRPEQEPTTPHTICGFEVSAHQ